MKQIQFLYFRPKRFTDVTFNYCPLDVTTIAGELNVNQTMVGYCPLDVTTVNGEFNANQVSIGYCPLDLNSLTS